MTRRDSAPLPRLSYGYLVEMRRPGQLLASGRDSDIFECGPGLVMRRARSGRSMLHEARIMEYLHSRSYPVPAVDGVSDDGTELVMERIDGLTMVDSLARAPWSVRRQGRTLADLHNMLHEIPAPEFLPSAPVGSGDRFLHMDLHPLNIINSPKGPVVIDWTNASCGDPAVDVGLAWVLMSVGEVPRRGVVGKLVELGRSLLVNSFVGSVDFEQARRQIRQIVEWKVRDPNMSPSEIKAMWRAVEKTEASHQGS